MIPTIAVSVGGHDVSAYLIGAATLTRGRSGEGEAVEPSTLSFQLGNNDGRFTPGLASGAWYPDITRGAVVTATVNSSLRFTGVVDSIGLQWPQGGDESAEVTITAVDVAASWQQPLLSLWEEWMGACAPIAWWPLTGSESPAAESKGDTLDRLDVQTLGGGTADMLQWGAGTGPSTDEQAALMVENTSSTVGAYLQSASSLYPPTTYATVCVVLAVNATSSGPLVEFTTGDSTVQVDFDTSGSTYRLRTWTAQDGWSSSTITTGSGTKILTVPLAADLVRGSRVRVAGGYQISGSAFTTSLRVLTTGTLSHLAILPGSTPAVSVPSSSAATATTWIDYLLQTSSDATPPTVTADGGDDSLAYLPLSGQSIAGMCDVWANGCLARWFVGRDGAVHWRDRAYAETTVDVDAGWVSPKDLQMILDGQGWCTTVDVTLPGGGTYTYDTGARPLVRRELVASLASDSTSKALGQWVANTAAADARLPQATVNLLTVPSSESAMVTALLDVSMGDRIQITGLPAQAPASAWTSVIEGVTETFGAEDWALSFVLSPAVTDFWTVDDAVLSEVDAGFRFDF